MPPEKSEDQTSSQLPVLELEEVKKQGFKFVIYENRILNVEGFKHPGSNKLIDQNLQTDVAALFKDIGHSAEAFKLVKKMTIGYLPNPEGKLMTNKYEVLTQEEIEMHAQLDELVDIKKPLLPQVRKLSNKQFKAFVRRPRFINDEDGIQLYEDREYDTRLKQSSYFEYNVQRILPLALFGVGASFASSSYQEFLIKLPLVMSFGLSLTWTFIEYFMHRFELHKEVHLDDNKSADPDVLEAIFSRHVHHHVFMNQRYRIILDMKTYFQFLVLGIVVTWWVPMSIKGIFLSSVLLGSLLYDWTHLAFHFEDVMPKIIRNTHWFQSMQAAHMRHHFRDNSNEFGVTLDIWDRVFGTTKKETKKQL